MKTKTTPKALTGALGASTVELVIVVAFLLPILIGSMFLAKIIHAHISLVDAAHAGARAGAIMLRDPGIQQWEFDEVSDTVTILHAADVQAAMLAATQAAIDADKYNLIAVQPEILCRCVKTNSDGEDEYSNYVACNSALIAGCNVAGGYTGAYRQIHARLQTQLTLDFPFILRSNYTLQASAIMQAAQVD